MKGTTRPATVMLSVAVILLVPGVGAIAQELPATSKEGLELVETTDGGGVYLRPGADFADYDAILMLDAYVGMDEAWLRNYNRQVMRTRRLRDKDVEEIKERIKDGFWQTFGGHVHGTGGYRQVAAAETGALILRPAIVNVSVAGHDVSGDTIVQNFDGDMSGSMTLVLEIYDASTSDLLARVFDRQDIGGVPDFGVESASVNRADENRVYQRWATSFVERFKAQ